MGQRFSGTLDGLYRKIEADVKCGCQESWVNTQAQISIVAMTLHDRLLAWNGYGMTECPL